MITSRFRLGVTVDPRTEIATEFIEILPPQKRVGEQWYQGTAGVTTTPVGTDAGTDANVLPSACPGSPFDNDGGTDPGVAEVPTGTPLRDIVDLAGGLASSWRLKAVVVGGPSGAILPPQHDDVLVSDVRHEGARVAVRA